METDEHVSLPSREAIESVENLYNAIHIRFPRAVAAFESRWMAWHEECLTATTTARYSDDRPLLLTLNLVALKS